MNNLKPLKNRLDKEARHIHWIEQDDKHYLSIGNKAPWLNFKIRVPLFVAKNWKDILIFLLLVGIMIFISIAG